MARRVGAVPWARTLAVLGPTVLVIAYFEVPTGTFGPEHPELSWITFGVALTVIAAALLREIRRELLEEPGRPVLVILLLLTFAVVAFAAAYRGLARNGEMRGLNTKVDALYFTVITLTTVGYGDITPTGQTARVVVMVQLLYTLVFLTAGGTALTRHLRGQFQRRTEERHRRGKN